MRHSNLDEIRQAHRCPFLGQGCAREDTCKLTAKSAKDCPWYAYFNYLTKEFPNEPTNKDD
jgi:hypothetical protein